MPGMSGPFSTGKPAGKSRPLNRSTPDKKAECKLLDNGVFLNFFFQFTVPKSAMPFSFSHPFAVLPLCNTRPFVFSAAVIGSMAPDFDSFLHLSTNVTFGHSAEGVLRFCLPAGMAVFLLFHGLLKEPLTALLPEGNQRRLKPFLEPRWPASFFDWILVILFLLLGVCSHLFLDSITHRYGWMVLKFPFLAVPLGEFGGHPLRLFSLFQHGGGLVGALVLFAAYARWYRKAPMAPEFMPAAFGARLRYGAALGMAVIAAATAAFFAASRIGQSFDPVVFVRDAVLMAVLSGFFVSLGFGIIWRLLVFSRRLS